MFVKLLLIVISRTKVAEKNRLSETNGDIFYFANLHDSQYYYLTLHSQRFATLPLRTPCWGAVRLKGNGVRVPNCPAAVSRPYVRARTKEPLKLCISLLSAWVWERMPYPHIKQPCRMRGHGKNAIPSYALGRCSRLGGESEDLPKRVLPRLFRCASRIGCERRNHYNDPKVGFG